MARSKVKRIPLVNLARQYELIRDEIESAIQGVIRSGSFILGENVERFEKEFASFCGVKYGVGVGSGADALLLALKALGIGPGDEVITTPLTFVATANAIVLAGAKPVFADIEPETYCLDPEKLEQAVTPRTKAIIPVHLYGHVCDMKPILEVAEKHGLFVVEDACQAHGALYYGARAGSLGICGCFSFYPTKNLGAYGDGGMVVTNDYELAEAIRLIRSQGQKTRYDYKVVGHTSRLDEIQAAILRVKLRYLDEWNEMRRRNAERYTKRLHKLNLVLPVEKDYAKHVYHLYVIRCKKRDELVSFLNQHGVEALIHYPTPIHLTPAYRSMGYEARSLPVSEQCAREIVSLPMFPELSEEEIEYVCNLIEDFLEKN